MRYAIVHDHLMQRGGAERVVACMAAALPGAPIYTSVYEPDLTYPEFRELDVRTLPINRIQFFRRDHRRALPLLLPAFPLLKVDADVVLCSSAGWCHSVRTAGVKVIYWHSPNRWIYLPEESLAGRMPHLALMLKATRRPLAWWDRRAESTAFKSLANSTAVRDTVQQLYSTEATVLHPPLMLDPSGGSEPIAGVEPGFVLLVSRLQPYKNVQIVVEAMLESVDRLVVVGSGPSLEKARSCAPENVTYVGKVTDAQLRWAYRHCKVLVAAAYEDFGLTPVEAAAFGKPTVALRRGGYLDTVLEELTGCFFDAPTPQAVQNCLARVCARQWDTSVLIQHARTFSASHFAARLRDFLEDCTSRV